MAFPVVQTRSTTFQTLPSGVAAGDLLVCVLSTRHTGTGALLTATGWTKVSQTDRATFNQTIFYRVATGSDAFARTTTGTITHQETIILRISGAAGTVSGTGTQTTTGAVDPPLHTPAGGAADFLWIASGMGSATSGPPWRVFTVGPTSYGNLTTVPQTVGSGGFGHATAERNLNAASENPGTFTTDVNTGNWIAYTLSVPPGGAPAPEGKSKVWTGSAFEKKPAKVWTGSAWVEKPVKVWTGSVWKTLT